jgi:hypothetical protein
MLHPLDQRRPVVFDAPRGTSLLAESALEYSMAVLL